MRLERPVGRVIHALLALVLVASTVPNDASAGELRLLERRVEIRQKTEAETDLPPNCVVTGVGARAHVDNITTFWVQYRPILADGTLGEARERRLGSEPDHACEAKIVVPEGWVMVGLGARGAPEWDVATLRVWGRRWDPSGKSTEVKVWSAGREPEAGLERSVLVEEPERVLVGVGLRFHQNDIQGIYARSARIERPPATDRALREVRPADQAVGDETIELFPTTLGAVPIAAVDADRIQAELLAAWRRGSREVVVKDDRLAGTAGTLAGEICRALMKDPFRDADEVFREELARRVAKESVALCARALRRVPLIARLAFSAAGKPFLGGNGIPIPDEVPALEATDRTLRAIAGEKEAARWLLVQSRKEVAALCEKTPCPWIEQVARELDDLAAAADTWEKLARAEVLSRMYLVDGAPATRDAAREAIVNAGASKARASFGDMEPLARAFTRRLATPKGKTELGAAFANIAALSAAGATDKAAKGLAALLENKRFQPYFRRHWDTIGTLATGIDAFGVDPKAVVVLWGGDGQWSIAQRAGRWAWVTTPAGPCVYVDANSQPAQVMLRFQYFDDGEGKIHVHYNSVDPESGNRHDYRPAPLVDMRGTGAWQEAEVLLDRCEFFGRQNRSADLRLIPDRRGVALRAIHVRETLD